MTILLEQSLVVGATIIIQFKYLVTSDYGSPENDACVFHCARGNLNMHGETHT